MAPRESTGVSKLLVIIPLCDREPLTEQVWRRRALHYIVRQCLASLSANISTAIDLVILADRCTDRFVHMAEDTLSRFQPTILDNSSLSYDLSDAPIAERYKHVINQFLRALELSDPYDILYFCEQDYLFKKDALDHALVAFAEIPEVNVLSLFDHPDRHIPEREVEWGRHRYFPTSRSTWKSVSSLNGNWLWRVRFARRRFEWLQKEFRSGALDFRITNALYRSGELLLCPVRSMIQHCRLDGTNTSPTYGTSWRVVLTKALGILLTHSAMLQRRSWR